MLQPLRRSGPGYDDDLAEWASHQARLLRERRFSELDLTNLVDEVESMPRSDLRAIGSHLTVLIAQLLKWRYQPSNRKGGWRTTIRVQRIEIAELLRDSPSLGRRLPELWDRSYALARAAAERDTGLPFEAFPDACPFTPEQVLDPEWLPEAVEGA